LAKALNVSSGTIDLSQGGVKAFVEEHVYRGFSRDLAAKSGIRVKARRDLEELADKLLLTAQRVRDLKNEIKSHSTTRVETAFPRHLLPALKAVLDRVSDRITESFKVISPVPFIERIELAYGDIGAVALGVSIVMRNGRRCPPRKILSEANLDLLALLVFIAVAEESAARGQAQFLVLDDVLQSIDSTIQWPSRITSVGAP
jgi:hypothetical protein